MPPCSSLHHSNTQRQCEQRHDRGCQHTSRKMGGRALEPTYNRSKERESAERSRSPGGGFFSSACSELRQDLRHVVFGSSFADAKPGADLLICQAFAQEIEDFPLPRGQNVWIRRPAASHGMTILRPSVRIYTVLRLVTDRGRCPSPSNRRRACRRRRGSHNQRSGGSGCADPADLRATNITAMSP